MAARGKSEPASRTGALPFPWRSGDGDTLLRYVPSARSVVAGCALLAVALGLYAVARATAVFAVREVEVRGVPPAVAADVRRALAPLVGESLLELKPAEVARRVAALPEVAGVSYDRAFPNTLVVVVRPELPIAVVRRGDQWWLVSRRGRVLRRVARDARPELPKVWVPKSVALERGRAVADPTAAHAIRALVPLAGAPLPRRVRTVGVEDGELTYVLVSGLELQVGPAAELELKLAVARRILPGLPPPWEGGPRYLDVSVPTRPVAGSNPLVED